MATMCERCGSQLSKEQMRWCSKKCSKLGLKSLWRKRNLERIKKYNRDYRARKNGGNSPLREPAKYRGKECLKCGADGDLQLAHVKPLWAGGNHNHLITLCRTHHYQFDNLLKDFWGV